MPKGWVWTEIETLVESGIQNGIYLPKSEYGSGTPILRIDDFQDGFSRPSNQLNLVRAKPEDIEKYSLNEGDLVINRVNSPSHLGKCLPVRSRNIPALFESNMMRLRLFQAANVFFLAFYLRSRLGKSRLISNAKWAVNQASINQTDVGTTPVPLPPLAEQHRIVAKIEELFTQLDAGVELLKKVKAKLKRYRQAVLKAAVEGNLTKEWREANLGELEPASVLLERILKQRREKWEAEQLVKMKAQGKTPKDDSWKLKYKEPVAPDTSDLAKLPDGWCWVRLDTIAALKGGITKDSNRKFENFKIIPYLRVANVQRGYLDLNEIKEIEANETIITELLLKKNDILFNEGGDRDKLGRGWIWQEEISECIHQNHVFRGRLYNSDLSAKFVSWCSNTYGATYFMKEGKQTTNLASINLSKLSAFPIPLPPQEEQVQIQCEVELSFSVIDQLEKTIDTNLKRAEKLRQTILKQAFEGKLVPQDPNDEPAEKLLERIKAEKANREADKKPKHQSTIKSKQPRKSKTTATQLELKLDD
ncbi:restriction endonuclease subunit S [Nostoc linckia]|uniref:restriction endonuclease subunit S n=1 Tax=Nostoc linckia TaxID=92942 RepID=UPI0015D4D16A|nr:restriction endonuclease subunit S [Nostoc linckia]